MADTDAAMVWSETGIEAWLFVKDSAEGVVMRDEISGMAWREVTIERRLPSL